MGRVSLLGIIYLVIGVVVAAAREYFDNVDNLEGIISAALAIVLWPLVLLGVDISIGDAGGGKGRNKGVFVPIGLAWTLVAYGFERFRREE
jgi:hypothetical protein